MRILQRSNSRSKAPAALLAKVQADSVVEGKLADAGGSSSKTRRPGQPFNWCVVNITGGDHAAISSVVLKAGVWWT